MRLFLHCTVIESNRSEEPETEICVYFEYARPATHINMSLSLVYNKGVLI